MHMTILRLPKKKQKNVKENLNKIHLVGKNQQAGRNLKIQNSTKLPQEKKKQAKGSFEQKSKTEIKKNVVKFGQGQKVYQDNQLESWNVPVVIKTVQQTNLKIVAEIVSSLEEQRTEWNRLRRIRNFRFVP